VPELIVRNYLDAGRVPADDILQHALPVEFFGRAGLSDASTRWFSQFTDDEELGRFLRDPQSGARQVARYVFDIVGRVRMGQFAAVATGATVEKTTEPRTFQRLPSDHGHFPEPYFENVLRGLRTAPPPYVVGFMAGAPVASLELPAEVDGMTVIRID
jgi:hypothetical protein